MSELFERCPACEGRRTTGRAASGAVALCDRCDGEGYVPAAVPGPLPAGAPFVHPWKLFSDDVRRREAEQAKRDATNRRAGNGKGGGA